MMTGMVQDQNLEKQIERHMGGCMAGFFHIFDRHQPLPAKRLITCSTKRHPHSSTVSPTRDDAESSADPHPATPEHHSTLSSLRDVRSQAPEPVTPSEASSIRSPLPFPLFEIKEGTRSTWRFSKEAPRLSLDSRAATDAKGGLYPREIRTSTAEVRPDNGDAPPPTDEDDQQRRSPSVIARLMGLENLPPASPESTKNAELRRSASESRVNKDLYRFIEGSHFLQNQQQQQPAVVLSNVIREGMAAQEDVKLRKIGTEQAAETTAHHHQRGPGGLGRRKSFYDSTDFFPEPAKRSASLIYEETERRLRMRGIDEPPKDLETLKQILDALQLKGLLHSKRGIVGGNAIPIPHHHTNFIYEKNFEDDSSPVVLMKPSRPSINRFSNRNESDSSSTMSFRSSRPTAARRSSPTRDLFPVTAASPRRENVRGQSGGCGRASPTKSDGSGVNNSPGRRRPMMTMNIEPKRVLSTVQPKFDPSRQHRSSQTFTNRIQGSHKLVTEVYPAEDESSTLSESSVSTPSQTDTERIKVEEYREGGRSLLERCDKLLYSIAEMTATSDLQPSPVSVLDAASFYKDESSPSPVMKRSIDFKDQSGELDDDLWSLISFKRDEKDDSYDDADFIYILDILRASNCLPDDSDVFLLLEKQHYLKGEDTSKVSRMHRQLVFDAVTEILERKRQFLQPGTENLMEKPLMQQVWSEFQHIRGRDAAENLFEVICGVLKKDLIMGDAVTGWGQCPVEVSQSVLDIERLIFKDLVSETIRDLAATFGPEYTTRVQLPCRRLAF
ncbi:hypothetical protein SAY87_013483 [Trapa incisa]|uniref:DUF4378 domain-containing protein n=1 Tax=Trapa incisa TaxID=236973 RepID=A0AAN7QG47_9MYRT|nr:hypothetical protein SAY87_013483 [Trapa incisa]